MVDKGKQLIGEQIHKNFKNLIKGKKVMVI